MYTNRFRSKLGCKVTMLRTPARQQAQSSKVECIDYRFRKSAQDARRSNLAEYRMAQGYVTVWPPIRGTQGWVDLLCACGPAGYK